MALIEDDTILHPNIDENVQLYVTALDEGPTTYQRFFDALLIKRASHQAFFADLRAFREQPQAIVLFEKSIDDRSQLREITKLYLSSRFAHPWCRTTPMKKSFWRSEWGSIEGKKKDTEIAKEEKRLHDLFVPIWIFMRNRMFPGDQITLAWCEKERTRRQQQGTKLTLSALRQHNEETNRAAVQSHASYRSTASEPEMNDDEDDSKDAARAATTVFRLAAAGVILSNTPKRKLRWITKKPT